jgi:hypothetical protein
MHRSSIYDFPCFVSAKVFFTVQHTFKLKIKPYSKFFFYSPSSADIVSYEKSTWAHILTSLYFHVGVKRTIILVIDFLWFHFKNRSFIMKKRVGLFQVEFSLRPNQYLTRNVGKCRLNIHFIVFCSQSVAYSYIVSSVSMTSNRSLLQACV